MDDEVIGRLVEDAIDSESREVLTMSRSRSVLTCVCFLTLSCINKGCNDDEDEQEGGDGDVVVMEV